MQGFTANSLIDPEVALQYPAHHSAVSSAHVEGMFREQVCQ